MPYVSLLMCHLWFQNTTMRINYKHLLTLFLAYLILLAWNGYLYGWGDMIELLPYAKWLNDSTLYPSDFFIQNISSNSANERFVLAYLFSLIGNKWMAIGAMILHIVCGMFLLGGLFRIAKLFIQSDGMAWVAILIPFVPLMNWNLGGNEMYIPLITSSTVAKSIAIWAVYFFIKKDKKGREDWYVYILLAIATFIQPLVGLQLFLILTGVGVLFFLFGRNKSFQNFEFLKDSSNSTFSIFPILFYLLTAGLWIFLLSRDFAHGEIDNRLFFDFLEFRIPHHFIPSYFSKKAALVLIPLFVFGLFYFYKKNKNVFGTFVLALLGLLIYTIGVEVFEISVIVSSQWFKTTIWLKSFSVIAFVAFLENKISFFRRESFSKVGVWGVRFLGVFSFVMLLNPISIFKNKAYDFTFLPKKYQTGWSADSDIEISKIAKATTPKDALFIIPASNTHFKFYSERSTYIDYKAVIHRKSVIPIWLERIKAIYGIDVETRRSGQDNVMKGNEFFRNLSITDLTKLSEKGIGYLLTFKDVVLPFDKIGENADYVIYKLN